MFERYERPVKIVCLALAALLVWQLGGLVLSRDPLAHLQIPALPALPAATNAVVVAAKSTNATATSQTNRTGPTSPTNAAARNSGPVGLPPGMPGERRGGAMKKIELPPEVQARVDRIINSEIFGTLPRPMPMLLLGIADQQAFIQATNGQSGPVKIGDEIGGIKLLRIGINRVLVEQGGEKKELTIFGGAGGESLMPKPADVPSTNNTSTNALDKKASPRQVAANAASTNQTLSSKQKEIP